MIRKFFFRGWLIWFGLLFIVLMAASFAGLPFPETFMRVWFVVFLLFTIGCIGLYFGQPPVVRVVIDDRDR
jgi:hypothetical protein